MGVRESTKGIERQGESEAGWTHGVHLHGELVTLLCSSRSPNPELQRGRVNGEARKERSSATDLQAIFLTGSRVNAYEGGGAELHTSCRDTIKVFTDVDELAVLLGQGLRRFEAEIADWRSGVRNSCRCMGVSGVEKRKRRKATDLSRSEQCRCSALYRDTDRPIRGRRSDLEGCQPSARVKRGQRLRL